MSDETKSEEHDEEKRKAEPEGGPLERRKAFLKERFTELKPKESREEISDEPEMLDDDAASTLDPKFRLNLVKKFRQRQRVKIEQKEEEQPEHENEITDEEENETSDDDSREPPPYSTESSSDETRESLTDEIAPPPANNWIPIGPSVLRKGQGGVQPATSGRAPGIAVEPGGTRVYVATANGGVWRSEDTGENWTSLMDAFDLNPQYLATDSLACGAIALTPGTSADLDMIIVGSGEGHGMGYFGVGPIVSYDGGQNWQTEPVSPGSTELAGGGFYALAIDPNDTDRLVAATNKGVYRREPDGSGGFHWVQKTIGGVSSTIVTSVVQARKSGVTTFYAARYFGPVYSSPDGDSWTEISTDFPTSGFGRVSLAVQEDNPDTVYAFLSNGHVYRYSSIDGTWRQITGVPSTNDLVRSQGWYDLAIAIAPNNENRIYLGGATVFSNGDWSGALYRCDITVSGTNVSMSHTYIGGSIHADVHTIVFTPGDSNKLWIGCDGGVFYTTNPTGSGNIFESRNVGLSTMTMNYLDQHPTEDAVVFCGTQDNGGERFTGEEAWLYTAGGDCGYYVINWADPYKVLCTYTYDYVRRSTDGGSRYSYFSVNVNAGDPDLFYAPLVGTPYNSGNSTEAERVAFGSTRPWISDTFGGNWYSLPNDTTADRLGASSNYCIKSLVFASHDKLYAGTMNGQVHRYTETSGNWTRTRLDTLGGVNDLPISGPITDIAVDPADATGNSIYITFGGFNDWRHVWHFDGNQWQHRSGPSDGHINSVLDVQHNAVIVDPQNPNHVYVGADIGIWRSVDGGLNWQPFSEGLPDASVMDLKLHNNRRLLRASTHGRGVYERTLGSEPKLGIELYVRDTQLDQGRFTTINGLNDPTDITKTVWHYHSVDIKLDTPDYYGNYQFPLTGTINFLQFTDTLTDDYQNVATHATATITTRVYVQVHNRGVIPADNVRVMLLLTPAAGGLPALPPGYQVNVQNGTPIETPDWTTVGIATLNDIRVGVPKIASLNLTSDKLPPPANLAGNQHHCVVALLHHDDDKYTSTITNTDQNTLQNRKAAHKNLHVVQFYGTVPTQPPVAVAVRINNAELVKKEYVISLRLDDYPDKVRVFIPPIRLTDEFKELIDGLYIDDDFDDFKKWSESHIEMLKMQDPKHQYHEEWVNQRVKDIQKVLDNPLMLNVENRKNASINGLIMDPSSYHTFFLMIDRPKDAKTGEYYNFNIQQWDSKRESLIGGMSTRIELVPKPESDEKYKLELRYHNLIFGYKLMRAKLTDESGAQITPSDGAKVVLTIQSGGDSTRSNMGYLSWLLSSFYSITMKKIDSASAVAFRDNVKVAETTL